MRLELYLLNQDVFCSLLDEPKEREELRCALNCIGWYLLNQSQMKMWKLCLKPDEAVLGAVFDEPKLPNQQMRCLEVHLLNQNQLKVCALCCTG